MEGFVGRLGWLAAQDGVGVGQRHACCGCFGALFCSRFELWPAQGGMTILILHSSSGHVPSHPALLADEHLVDNSGDYYVFANKANACIFLHIFVVFMRVLQVLNGGLLQLICCLFNENPDNLFR